MSENSILEAILQQNPRVDAKQDSIGASMHGTRIF